MLALVLEDLRGDIHDSDDDALLEKALLECDGFVEEVYQTVDRFSSNINSDSKRRKTWASMKVVKREKIILALERRLEHAKSTLTLALQSSSR